MFSLNSILKRRLTHLVMATIITLSFGLFGQPAQAAGETYTWKDATDQAILASGGAYKVPATLTKSGTPAAGGAEFSGSVELTCPTTTVDTTIKLTVNGDNYTKIYPSLANLNAQPIAYCAKLNSPIAISKSDGLTTTQIDAAAARANGTANDGKCNQGVLTYIFCPIIDNLSSSINNLVKSALVPLLEVKPISPENTPELHQVWLHVRDLTEILFILVFIVIIYATVAEQDIAGFNKYTVKRMLPRLVAAAILVQFSFSISSLMVDIGNVLGGGIEQFVLSGLTASGSTNMGAPSLTNALGNMVVGSLAVLVGAGAIAILATWTIALPLLLSLFISIFVVFLTLGARYLLIAILIAISPLAMLAWVLPNTETYFTQWRKLFLGLILMYPIIVGVLALATIVTEILPFTSDTANTGIASVAVAIIRPLIAIAAFLMVPAAFKIASKGLDQFTGYVKSAGSKTQGIHKGSEFWQRSADGRKARQADYMNRFNKSDGIKALGSGGAFSRGVSKTATFAAGTAFLNAPKTVRGTEKLRSGIIATNAKTLGELEEATAPNLQKVFTAFYDSDATKRATARRELQSAAPNLMSLASTPVGRVAVQKRLAEMGLSNDSTLKSLKAPNGPRLGVNGNIAREFPDLLIAGGKEFANKPTIMARISRATDNYEIKDALGNVARTIHRDVGDVDTNVLNGLLRSVTATTFGDKHSIDNFKQMGKRGDGDPQINQAAEEIATSYANNIDSNAIERAFDSSRMQFASRGARYEWLKNMEKNRDIFKRENPRVYEAALTHFEQDEDITTDIGNLAGLHKTVIDSLSTRGKANMARDWMRGVAYDPSHNYETGGKSVSLVP